MNDHKVPLQYLKKIVRILWSLRSKVPFFNFPLLCPLPHGGWFLAYGDEMGLSVILSLLLKRYEAGERYFVFRFLRPGMVFFDIGANQGFYTVLAAKRVGADGKVFAFEPAPGELKKLKRNLKINRLTNVIAELVALGDEEEYADMFVFTDDKGCYSSLRQPLEKGRIELMQILVTTLDRYVLRNNISTIDFIKVDIEGGELSFLSGAIQTINKFRPLIMCELADMRTRQWGYEASEIYNFLADYDYKWFSINPKGALYYSPIKARYDPDWENLVGIPEEKLDQVSEFKGD